jgi:hypothetical protein
VSRTAYATMVSEIATIVRDRMPADATLLVATGGDVQLLGLGPQRALDFPASADPDATTGMAAVAHLEALRAKGADLFLVPSSELSVLDDDPLFDRHLRQRYPVVVDDEDVAIVFSLRDVTAWDVVRQTVLECELGGDVSVLDWRTGLDLRGRLADLVVFSPLFDSDELPYLDASVEVVVVGPGAGARELAEARRVARLAVLVLVDPPSVEWKARPRWPAPEPLAVESGSAEEANELAARAEGEAHVFVLGHTCPLPGSVSPLGATLRDRPDAGAVGGALYAFDGAAVDVRPPYVHAVDDLAPALLATPRALFESLGGFRSREPVRDYCARARAAGYAAYYQPEAAAVRLDESG